MTSMRWFVDWRPSDAREQVMERFVIDAYGVDEDAEREGFRWLLAKANELGTDATVIVPAVSSIENLTRVLGNHAATAKQRRVLTIDGVRVHFVTPKTHRGGLSGPVLVMWADTEMVEAAERRGPPAVCAIGWSEDGLDGWKRSWAPIDPRTGHPDGEAIELPAGVRGAVESLSGLANDVLHPSDKRRAVNAFRALRMRGAAIDPGLVRSFAVSIGWEPGAADRLTQIARGISEGRAVRGGDKLTQAAAKELVARFEGAGP
jgi:hypothetical protein